MYKKVVLSPDKGIQKYKPKDLIDDAGWSEGNNVHFCTGYMQKVSGWQKWYNSSLGSPILGIDNFYKYNGDSWLIICTNDKIYKYNTTTKVFDEIGTGLLATQDHPVFIDTANDTMIYTNGVDKIKSWDGVATTISDLAGLTDCEGEVTDVRAKCMIYTNNFLMLGGTTENGIACPQRIRWSRIGNINNWKNETDGTGQAGWADLSDGVDWIQRILPFQNYIIVYKERSIQVLSYVGGTTIWDKRPAIVGTGLLAPNAIIDLGTEQIFIGPDNIYSYDLVEVKIAGDEISKDFFKDLDPSKSHMTTSFFIEETPEAWFPYVSVNSPNGYHDRALVYNVDTKAWSIRDMPMSAYGFWNLDAGKTIDEYTEPIDSYNEEFDTSTKLANAPINLCGDANGYIYVLDGQSKDGVDLSCYVCSKLFDLDNPGVMKRLKRIQLMTSREGSYNLPIYVGTCDNVDEEIVWHGPYDMNLDKTYPPWVDVDLTSRYFMIKMGTENKDEPFKLTGYILYYDVRSEM